MKILYAIQGTGNGHLSRAKDIIPILKTIGAVDVLVSGCEVELCLPFEIKYKLKGFGFVFGKKGGIDFWKTIVNLNIRTFFNEIRQLPVANYDLIISDFEPVSAWASFFKGKKIIGLSHQIAVINANSPKYKKGWFGRLVLRHYAPVTYKYGFHFKCYSKGIFGPVIRQEIRNQKVTNRGHYTVYLPSFAEDVLVDVLASFKNVQWEVFSKRADKIHFRNGIMICPIENDEFVKSLASCEGLLCGAGFEAPAEALFLGKKLMVIPMKNQYEQLCNGVALQELGVPVINGLRASDRVLIEKWIAEEQNITIAFPDESKAIVHKIVSRFILEEMILEEHNFESAVPL
ncbi:MAG: glycosyl transferase [Flavobacteriaceae bacterium]|nr:MAG: glycosyl transferase [Flavobacteriaceae bacterium]